MNKLDLILRADSLTELTKLVFATRRIGVISAAIFWLLLNIAAQAGIAAVSLTYGFETDEVSAMLSTGTVMIPDMQHFYPLGTAPSEIGMSESYEDERFTAHLSVPMINVTRKLTKRVQIRFNGASFRL